METLDGAIDDSMGAPDVALTMGHGLLRQPLHELQDNVNNTSCQTSARGCAERNCIHSQIFKPNHLNNAFDVQKKANGLSLAQSSRSSTKLPVAATDNLLKSA